MKKIIQLSIFALILFLVSCNKNEEIEQQPTAKIPIDSIYFSCKINDQTIEFKSPTAEKRTWSEDLVQQKKIKKSTKDSIFVSYAQTFSDEHYRIEIGFSDYILSEIDTNSVILSIPNQKSHLLRKGIHNIQYLEQGFDYTKYLAKYCGFRIRIVDLTTGVNYSSYISFHDPNIVSEFSNFTSKSSFEITELTELNTGIYKDYINTWFFRSKFHCNLYINSDSTKPVVLTDGVLNCCF